MSGFGNVSPASNCKKVLLGGEKILYLKRLKNFARFMLKSKRWTWGVCKVHLRRAKKAISA